MKNLNKGFFEKVTNKQGEKKVASRFKDFDYMAIGKSLGCIGYTVEDLSIVKKALGAGQPVIIDIKTTDEESFRKVM